VLKPEKMYKTGHEFTYELHERLISVWCELNQSVVNHAIDDWRRRLSACVNAEGGHFEHYL